MHKLSLVIETFNIFHFSNGKATFDTLFDFLDSNQSAKVAYAVLVNIHRIRSVQTLSIIMLNPHRKP